MCYVLFILYRVDILYYGTNVWIYTLYDKGLTTPLARVGPNGAGLR